MNERIKGFTLVECCCCIALFSIFIECIWGFYTHIYLNYMQFTQQIHLMNEANNIETFIKQCLREAKQVKIIVQEEGEEVLKKTEHDDRDVVDKMLKKIEFTKIIKTGEESEERECAIQMVSIKSDKQKGKWKLVYTVEGESTANTISDQIEGIKITQYKNSSIVQFKCLLNKREESNKKLIYQKIFSESLEYKKREIKDIIKIQK